MNTLKKTGTVPLLLAGAISLCSIAGGCAPTHAQGDTSISKTGFFLDTIVTIKLFGTEDETLIDDCFQLTREYENLLSRTIEGSDVWNINHSGGKPVEVSEETSLLLQTALEYCELSGGQFDITIAPVVSLWNFNADDQAAAIPDEAPLAEALSHVDYHTIALDGTTVTLQDPEASIDLGGIAKGFIADRIKELLTSKGIESALIDLGGNMLTVGRKPNGNTWNIGIRKPFSELGELAATVRVDDLSVVTSGTYERYFELDGTLYHHILDPRNGYPVNNGLTSVTILSEHSMDGDALSTTCFTLGLTDGLALAESLENIEALFITADNEPHYTSGWPQN